MVSTVLITGASGGIGEEFARIAGSEKNNLVLVARQQEKLDALADELRAANNIDVHVFALDLTENNAAQRLFEQTQAAGIQIDILINNAGFGGHGKFHERPLKDDEAMMQLNMLALTSLTHLYLQGMVERKTGKVLNVASTAGFLPGPLQAVYFATKAYVNSFSFAIAEELSDTGVSVTALCPGPVKTGFIAAGNLEGTDLFKDAATADEVARVGWHAMNKGHLVAFDKASLGFMLQRVIPWLPRKVVLKMSRKMMEKSI